LVSEKENANIISRTSKVSILMPAFNEGKHIYRNLKETEKVTKQLGLDHEIIVVDDGSTDNTSEEITRAAQDIPDLVTLRSPKNRGKGWALKRAFGQSSGEYVFFLDSDLDIHPRQFQTMLDIRDQTGADVVIGSKRHPESTLNYPRSRRFISSVYFFLVKALFGLPLRDTQTGIKLFTRGVLEHVMPCILVKKHAFDLEILVTAHGHNFTIAEAPVVVEYQGKFGHIGVHTIWTILVDTAAIWYRTTFLGYYDRPLASWPDKPTVSILIPCKTHTSHLAECLDRISRLDYPDYEVLLLPNGDMDITREGVRVIATGDVPPPRKRNIGWVKARGEIIAFIDDDAWPEQNWLANAVRHFGDPSVAAVGGPSSFAPTDDSREQAAEAVLSSLMVGGTQRYRTIPKMLMDVDDQPTSNLLVRTSALEEIGGFDTRYWPGEDTLLCRKITRQLGKRIIYDPDVNVMHHRRPLFQPFWRQAARFGLHRGYFAKKFPETSRRISYFLPSATVLYLLLGWIPLVFVPGGGRFYAASALFYLLCAGLTGMWTLGPRRAWMVMAGIIGTHLVYGLNFIKGLCSSRMPEE